VSIGICIFGAGRIGKLHAANILATSRARVVSVVDVNLDAATALAAASGARAGTNVEEALAFDDVDAVVICAPTNLHVHLILASARMGKGILCEKPIDLDIMRVDACLSEMERYAVPFAVGFNRRFDPTIARMKRSIDEGEIGNVEILIITSRDPAPPPVEYVRTSGGYFRDSTIHDLDLARWMLGEEPISVSAFGSNLVDPEIGEEGDFDTAITSLRTATGKLCQINNSRRATYGFDQRVEVFGSAGMMQTLNQPETGLLRYGTGATAAQDPLKNFFLERYEESFRKELDDFLDAVEVGHAPAVTGEDGRQALKLADAAELSARTGKTIAL
jgi:myo-inositol 2-dehydrogenase/D-chiro-inositol 1-dehydrogenase